MIDLSKLRELRENKNLYQKDIAKLLNTTQQVYSEYEIGIRVIPLEKIYTLADFYETSIDYLTGRTNERKPYPKKEL